LDPNKADHTSGKGWALTGFLTGVTVSILANIARMYVPPEHAPANWKPHPGAVATAAWWPIALLISIEVISRVQWPDGFIWRAIRYGGLTTVAAIAAIISYRHMSGLLSAYGESGLGAKIGPLAVDGLMVVSSGALLAIADNVRRAARAAEASTADRPTMTETTTEAPVPTSETDTRREAARELAALDSGLGAEVPATAPESLPALLPEGGAATGALGPEIDATALLEALNELAADGGPSGGKLAAALGRRGVEVTERDARRVLAVLRPSKAGTDGDGAALEPTPDEEPATATEPIRPHEPPPA
jgi:hypothetical protein